MPLGTSPSASPTTPRLSKLSIECSPTNWTPRRRIDHESEKAKILSVTLVVGLGLVVEIGVPIGLGLGVGVEVGVCAMKKIIEEFGGEGLQALRGERVALWCANYIYAGKLVSVNETDVLLDDAKVVYETGELCAKGWKDAQPLPGPWYVRTAAIESYGKVDK